MKMVILLIGFLVLGATCFADPVEGYWVSIDDKTGRATAGWQIYTEHGQLYGKILSISGYPQDVKALKCKKSYRGFPFAGDVSAMPVIGTPWIFGLQLVRNGEWSKGNIIDPESGNMYQCRIIFHAADGKRYSLDTLEMRGEIGLGIGRSQFWRKSTHEESAGLR
ncbi:MAG: DUF2147 domain-containing protein [Treponema sp.]|jgi:uncharacterized protein (DUF2147 family)|nr:DUF2147 domain-containing protein [Treponema sp.]